MYKLFLGLMAVSLFIGCSSKEEQSLMKSYTENIQYHKYLQKTEKAELLDGENSVAILTATYLYTPNFEKDNRKEVFIVGVVFEDPDVSSINFDANSSTTVAQNEYILTLKGKKAIKVVPLGKNDKRLEGISFVTEWANYYEVTYRHTASQRFSLVFENPLYGKETLNFSKVAKFVYTKKGF